MNLCSFKSKSQWNMNKIKLQYTNNKQVVEYFHAEIQNQQKMFPRNRQICRMCTQDKCNRYWPWYKTSLIIVLKYYVFNSSSKM